MMMGANRSHTPMRVPAVVPVWARLRRPQFLAWDFFRCPILVTPGIAIHPVPR